MVVGSVAASSRTLTASSEPLPADAILCFATELLGTEAVGARGVEPDAERASSLAQAS